MGKLNFRTSFCKAGFLSCFFVITSLVAHAQIITTIVGNGTGGYNSDNIQATAAEIYNPEGVAIDRFGNLYIADAHNYRVRKVSTSGVITTIAGSGSGGDSGDNGPATMAKFYPFGVAVDTFGNVYIADASSARVRKVNSSGIITTYAGNGIPGSSGDNGLATAAQLGSPFDVALDVWGNLYIADGPYIRKVNTGGVITTFAGNAAGGFSGDGGPATAASFDANSVAVDKSGNVYISDEGNRRIRKVNTTGIITTIAGDGGVTFWGDNGPATAASVGGAVGVAVDRYGNVYICDGNYHVRKVNAFGTITTVAGNGVVAFSGDGGPATLAQLDPVRLVLDTLANMYISDAFNDRIRFVTSSLSVSQLRTNAERIQIFPNPTQDRFTVNITSAIEEEVQVTISNLLGDNLKQIIARTNRPLEIMLDAPSGIYLLSAVSAHDDFTTKIIIRH